MSSHQSLSKSSMPREEPHVLEKHAYAPQQNEILQLQRLIGNQASQRHLAIQSRQRQLTVQRVEITIAPRFRAVIGLGNKINTSQMTKKQLEDLAEGLRRASENPRAYAQDLNSAQELELVQEEISQMTIPLTDAIEAEDYKKEPSLQAPEMDDEFNSFMAQINSLPQIQTENPKPQYPHLGKVKPLRGNFGQAHEAMHFAPTDQKKHHGVWQGSLSKVKAWVSLALSSIRKGDNYVMGFKPGTNGTIRYLVNMAETIGYLSGTEGKGAPSTHMEVYMNEKGITDSAFPSDPSIF